MYDFKNMNEQEIYDAAAVLSRDEDYIAGFLSWNEMDKNWKESLAKRGDGWWFGMGEPEDPYMKKLLPLRDRLLGIAGESVCFPGYEEDLSKIMQRGVLWDGYASILMEGAPSQCHSNSAYLWDENRRNTIIATGYALSEDGMWRQHTWCVGFNEEDEDDPLDPYIIETTVPRVAYFGFPMTYDECELFLYENS